MPIYSIQAPNGKTYDIEGPEGASQDDVINAVLAQHPDAGTPAPRKSIADTPVDNIRVEDQRPAPPRKFLGATGEQWREGLGAGAANVIEGAVNNTVGMLANPLNQTINAVAGTNLETNLGADLAERLTGAPVDDSLGGAIQRGLAGGMSMAGLAKAVAGAVPGVVGTGLAELGATPLADTFSGGLSEGAAKLAEQMGGGPVSQIAASLLGGGLGYAGFRKAFDEAGGKVLNEGVDAAGRYVDFEDADGSVIRSYPENPEASMTFGRTPNDVEGLVGAVTDDSPQSGGALARIHADQAPAAPANTSTENISSLHGRRVSDIEKLLEAENPSINDVGEAINYLDEAYSQGLPVEGLQDRLIDLEKRLETEATRKTTPTNDNISETPRDKVSRELEILQDEMDNVESLDAQDALYTRIKDKYSEEASLLSDEELMKGIENARKFPHRYSSQVEEAYGAELANRNRASIREKVPVAERTPEQRALVNTDPVTMGPSEDLIQRFTAALNDAGRLNKEQQASYSRQRAQRFARGEEIAKSTSGEEGLRMEKAALRGELDKIEFEGVRNQFSADELKSLFEGIKNSDQYTWIESVNAREGLIKLLDGQVPTKSELDLLANVFPKDFIKAALSNRKGSQKVLDATSEALSLPRAMMSTADASAPLRQGVFMVSRPEFWKSFGSMFKQMASEEGFQAVKADIRSRPTHQLMEEYNLALTDFGHDLSKREEDFMSRLPERIPGFKHLHRASERAYSGFLNKLRADVFDSIVSRNPDMVEDPAKMAALTRYINNATGRGDLPTQALKDAAPLLNALFFSPRLISSRVQLMNPGNYIPVGKGLQEAIDPNYYITLPPEVRKEAVRDLIGFGGTVMTVLGLAAMNGAEVELDPRSSDFAKIKVGNTRFDVMGGMQQYIRLAAQLATGEKKTLAGDIKKLGEGFREDTRWDVIGKFFTNKTSPVASYVIDYFRGANAVGEDFDPVKSTLERFTPMFASDVYDAYTDDGLKGLVMATPGFFGVGVNTYEPKNAFNQYGQSTSGTVEDTPAIAEMKSLDVVKPVSGTLRKTKNFPEKKLTKEEKDAYQEMAGKLTTEKFTNYLEDDPEWDLYTDEYKKEVLEDIAKEARKEAREVLFQR